MDGITRFTDRADEYAQGRPLYPQELIRLIKDAAHLEPGSRVADVGSGTGLLTSMLLKTGATVFACEPNEAMRAEAEALLGHDPGFISLDAKAEDLPFDDAALDLITCGQSFHWFDRDAAQREFGRVLHGAGMACLVWNALDDGDPFSLRVHELLRRAHRDSELKVQREPDAALRTFFVSHGLIQRTLKHVQELPLRGVVALARSRSYWPKPDTPQAEELESELLVAAEQFQSRQGQVVVRYECSVTMGRVADYAGNSPSTER